MEKRIGEMLELGFERSLFEAAIANLQTEDSPLQFNNFAYAMREVVRHVLGRLAPDAEVRRCQWYRNETERENGISRKQRAYYAVQGGLSDVYVKGTLNLELDDIHTSLIKAVNELSKYTHIEPDTFNIPSQRVQQLANETLMAVDALFSTIRECHEGIIHGLWEQLDAEVVNAALRESIGAIDELATHHWIREVYTEKVSIVGIDSAFVNFEVTGTILCQLQWGSNSDLRNDTGAVTSQSFPFRCELRSSVEDPGSVEAIEETLGVDTSYWHGNDIEHN